MGIYYVPVAPSETNGLGTKSNPIYKGDLLTSYTRNITHCKSTIIDYASACADFRSLFYAFSGGQLPNIPAAKLAKLNAAALARQNGEKASDTNTKNDSNAVQTAYEKMMSTINQSASTQDKNSSTETNTKK